MKGWETAWAKVALSEKQPHHLANWKNSWWKTKPVGHGLLMFICLQFVKLQRTSKTFLSVFVCSTWFRFMTFSWTLNRTDLDAKSAAYKEGRYQWSVAIDDFMPSSPFGASSLHRLDPLPRSCAAQASPECLKARHEYGQHKHTEKPSCVKKRLWLWKIWVHGDRVPLSWPFHRIPSRWPDNICLARSCHNFSRHFHVSKVQKPLWRPIVLILIDSEGSLQWLFVLPI